MLLLKFYFLFGQFFLLAVIFFPEENIVYNLEVKTGERVALIGQNGSGKSTILKIISNQETIDSGAINIRKGATLGILNQIYENEKDDISVKEFLYESFKEIFEI